MAAFYLALGSLVLPLAILLRLETGVDAFYVYVFAAIGSLCIIGGLINTQLESKQNIREKDAYYSMLESIGRNLKNILSEIRQGKK